jgi:hypothetical protein
MHGLVKNNVYEDYHHLGEYITNVYDLLWHLNLKGRLCLLWDGYLKVIHHNLICTQGCFQILERDSFIVRFLKNEKKNYNIFLLIIFISTIFKKNVKFHSC